jgi:GNAT superfamily N-acetyltransferase
MSVHRPHVEAEVESIERATLDAVPPQATATLDGWLLAFDDGTVGRAHSAVPLTHAADGPAARSVSLAAIEAAYAARGLPALLRVPMLGAFAPWADALRDAGYAQGKPTSVWTGEAATVLAARRSPRTQAGAPALTSEQMPGPLSDPPSDPTSGPTSEPTSAAMAAQKLAPTSPGSGLTAQLLASPDDGWRDVFLGEGFDPVDGASRVAILARARHAAFACVRDEAGLTLAAGMGSYSHGWASIHGMRTRKAWRGRGLASAILHLLAQEAVRRGIARMFLQVERGNEGARSLYAGLGFQPAWDYAYWSRRSG